MTAIQQQCFLLTIIFISHVRMIQFSTETVVDLTSILSEGKQQMDLITAKTKMKQYGPCWTQAVGSLEVGCRHLTELSQSALALRLTDCFLQMSGQGPLMCELPRQDCLKKLSDRAFNAYTEFYTHTQNICYFLQSKLWHEETERTIDKLTSTSQKVSLQLSLAEKGQELLLSQQKESLNLQEHLGATLETSRGIINSLIMDIKETAIEQKAALISLFEQLAMLQTWVVGEISWFDSLCFYCSSSLLLFLFTSTARTERARLLLYIFLCGVYVYERYIVSKISENKEQESIYVVGANITHHVWWLRNIFLCASAFVLVFIAATFSDYNLINNKLLLDIKKQNDELARIIKEKNYATNYFELDENSTQKSPMISRSSMINTLGGDKVDNFKAHNGNMEKMSLTHVIPSHECLVNKPNHLRDSLNSFVLRSSRNSVDLESNHSRLSSASDVSEKSSRRSVRLMKMKL